MSVPSVRWFKNGDHPEDGDDVFKGMKKEGKVVRYFRHPTIPSRTKCNACGNIMHIHGWIDNGGNGNTVCPGDYVIKVDGIYYPSKNPLPA